MISGLPSWLGFGLPSRPDERVFKSSFSPFSETPPTKTTPPKKRLKSAGDRYAPVPTKQSEAPTRQPERQN
jgi:hypothetical protein